MEIEKQELSRCESIQLPRYQMFDRGIAEGREAAKNVNHSQKHCLRTNMASAAIEKLHQQRPSERIIGSYVHQTVALKDITGLELGLNLDKNWTKTGLKLGLNWAKARLKLD